MTDEAETTLDSIREIVHGQVIGRIDSRLDQLMRRLDEVEDVLDDRSGHEGIKARMDVLAERLAIAEGQTGSSLAELKSGMQDRFEQVAADLEARLITLASRTASVESAMLKPQQDEVMAHQLADVGERLASAETIIHKELRTAVSEAADQSRSALSAFDERLSQQLSDMRAGSESAISAIRQEHETARAELAATWQRELEVLRADPAAPQSLAGDWLSALQRVEALGADLEATHRDQLRALDERAQSLANARTHFEEVTRAALTNAAEARERLWHEVRALRDLSAGQAQDGETGNAVS